MSDAFSVLAGLVALAAPALSGPIGPYEAAPALALHGTRAARASRSIEIAYRDGETLGRIGVDHETMRRADLPDAFVNALIAVEDASFERHMGVDPVGIARAALGTALGRDDAGGGSTLTQQFVKNAAVGSRRTFERKIEEVIAAVMTESIAGKDEILESYANVVFFGRRSEGGASAAMHWFEREWSELDLAQNAFLAGVLQAPSGLDPQRAPARAKARRDHVLSRMAQTGMISERERDEAIATPLVVAAPPPPPEPGMAPEDADFWAISEARRFLPGDNFIDIEGEEAFRVTLDRDAQAMAQAALDDMLAQLNAATGFAPLGTIEEEILGIGGNASSALWPKVRNIVPRVPAGARRAIVINGGLVLEPGPEASAATEVPAPPARARDGEVYLVLADGTVRGRPRVQGALVAIDGDTGTTLASVGGTASWASAFDRTRARRQPGSSIKPFVWLAGLERGLRPDTFIVNQPLDIVDGGEVWSPRNYQNDRIHSATLFTSLERSLNMVAARIGAYVGAPTLRDLLVRSNAYPYDEERLLYPSTALGAVETTPFRMALATSSLDPRRSDLSQPAWLTDLERMMRGVVVRGTGARAFQGSPIAVAGKTGTSQSFRDAWFIARTGDLAVAVWIGRDDDKPLPSVSGSRPTGGVAAAPVAARFLAEMHKADMTTTGIESAPFDNYQDSLVMQVAPQDEYEPQYGDSYGRGVAPQYYDRVRPEVDAWGSREQWWPSQDEWYERRSRSYNYPPNYR